MSISKNKVLDSGVPVEYRIPITFKFFFPAFEEIIENHQKTVLNKASTRIQPFIRTFKEENIFEGFTRAFRKILADKDVTSSRVLNDLNDRNFYVNTVLYCKKDVSDSSKT